MYRLITAFHPFIIFQKCLFLVLVSFFLLTLVKPEQVHRGRGPTASFFYLSVSVFSAVWVAEGEFTDKNSKTTRSHLWPQSCGRSPQQPLRTHSVGSVNMMLLCTAPQASLYQASSHTEVSKTIALLKAMLHHLWPTIEFRKSITLLTIRTY